MDNFFIECGGGGFGLFNVVHVLEFEMKMILLELANLYYVK